MSGWLDQTGLFAAFHKNPPVSEHELHASGGASDILPSDYREFLKHSNGGEGFIGEAYLVLWQFADLPALNEAYQAWYYAPGFLLFGSSAGGEALAFDLRSPEKPVVSLPFVGMDASEAEPLASSFRELLLTKSSEGVSQSMPDAALLGLEIFEIKPVILGGSPTDPENKMLLTREKHIEFVRWWNERIREIRTAEHQPS